MCHDSSINICSYSPVFFYSVIVMALCIKRASNNVTAMDINSFMHSRTMLWFARNKARDGNLGDTKESRVYKIIINVTRSSESCV
jgi:hypothetical protein